MDTSIETRLTAAIRGLGLSQMQAAVEAKVAPETLRKVMDGGPVRPTTMQRVTKWLAGAERRLERRVPRP